MIKITYFVHGTTTDNENGIATGWLPGELSELGKKQAIKLGELVADRRFDIVFCSDLKRAVDSARLGFGSQYKIIEDQRLREANYGDFNGQPENKFKSNLALYIDTPFPGGENYKDVEERLKKFCEFIKTNYDGKRIAIVAHQAPQLALDVLLKNKTWLEAITDDWRRTKSWRPGWEYEIKD